MKIRVMNLPRSVDEKELERIFWPYGKVAGGQLVMDAATGRSKGFGFVDMPQQEKALAAITALHGSKVGKNTIRVKEAIDENAPEVKTGRQKFRDTVRQKNYERAQESRAAGGGRGARKRSSSRWSFRGRIMRRPRAFRLSGNISPRGGSGIRDHSLVIPSQASDRRGNIGANWREVASASLGTTY